MCSAVAERAGKIQAERVGHKAYDSLNGMHKTSLDPLCNSAAPRTLATQPHRKALPALLLEPLLGQGHGFRNNPLGFHGKKVIAWGCMRMNVVSLIVDMIVPAWEGLGDHNLQ